VQLPVKFELVINIKAVKGLGITIPESFLLRVDEVIDQRIHIRAPGSGQP
jgi:putative tryptophan/tyrosine transport system substrate-binding protein